MYDERGEMEKAIADYTAVIEMINAPADSRGPRHSPIAAALALCRADIRGDRGRMASDLPESQLLASLRQSRPRASCSTAEQ